MKVVHNCRIVRIIPLLAIVAGLCSLAAGKVIYVDDDATGGNPLQAGSSWADAHEYLQDALMVASGGDEIRVAQGVYRPDEFVLSLRPNMGRLETFGLKDGVVVKGGYAGLGEADPDARDVALYQTVLSGDIGTAGDNSDNSYHVVTGTGTDAGAVLDGFTIMGGNANGSTGSNTVGGGMYVGEGSPTVTNCTFNGNWAASVGGGMYNQYGSCSVTGCSFVDNWAFEGGGGICSMRAGPTLSDCAFSGNTTNEVGGGMWNIESPASVEGCTFIANHAELYGGGAYNEESAAILKECVFSGNSSWQYGGGLCNAWSNARVSGCTFDGNWAQEHGGGMFNVSSSPVLSGCGFIGNFALQAGGGVFNHESSPTVEDCDFNGNVTDGFGGGMYNKVSFPAISGCTFSANGAFSYGGGVGNQDSDVTMTNCIFGGNLALEYGGGMISYLGDTALTNCTFGRNWAGLGGGGVVNQESNCTIVNCILWSDVGPETLALMDGSEARVSYSDVHSVWVDAGSAYLEGAGNLAEDPCFASHGYWADVDDPNIPLAPMDPNALWVDADYHLMSQAGRWTSASSVEPDPNSARWVKDDVTSRCIDAGEPSSDWTGELWPHGKRINMGAFGGTPQASMSLTDIGDIANLNNDENDAVDWLDFAAFGRKWRGPEAPAAADLNRDGVVDFGDCVVFAMRWLGHL